MLIFRTLRERDDAALMEGYSLFSSSTSTEGDRDDESGEFRGNSSADYEEDMCCGLGEDTSDFLFSFNRSSVDGEDEVAEKIEECFLKQPELDLKDKNGDLEEELACSESNTKSCIPTSEANEGSSLRKSNGLESAVVNFQNLVSDAKSSEDNIEDDKAVEMVVEALNLPDVKPTEEITDPKEVEMAVEALNLSFHE